MAGGTGSRMGNGDKSNKSALPKQFMEIGNADGRKPIIMHTLSRFLESGCFDAIYIGMHPDWVEYMGDLLVGGATHATAGDTTNGDADGTADYTSKISLPIPSGGLHIISGGNDRNSTLLNVLDAVESDLRDLVTSDTALDSSHNPNLDEYDPIIVTHDAVRPFVTPEMIENSIEAAKIYGAATVAIPTTDTIASTAIPMPAGSDDANSDSPDASTPSKINTILDRSALYNIQTPQSFKLSAFREAYSALTNAQISILTDVCGIFTSSGHPVAIVPGTPSNFKITTPFDLKMAELCLE